MQYSTSGFSAVSWSLDANALSQDKCGPRPDVLVPLIRHTTRYKGSLSLFILWSWGNAFASWGIIAGYDLGTLSD